jgi:peptide/nickel transport system permease protein
MRTYVLRRLLHSLITLVGVSLVVFGILRILPGDPARMMLPDGAPQSAVDEMSRGLGLDKPLYVQYIVFVQSVARGDFGQSFQYRAPATAVVGERVWPTIHLSLAALAITVLVGVPAGILAAARRGTILDYGSIFLTALGQSLPNFWLGIMLILLFGVALGWLPTSDYQGPIYLVLPSITLAAFPTALVARLTRSSMLEVLGREYIRTARSKGLRESAVIIGHALKNAAIPVITILGLQIGVLLGGAVITESVFSWPGIGKLVVDSIFRRDFPVVQAILILSATIFIVINFVVDMTYTVLDPRIKYA